MYSYTEVPLNCRFSTTALHQTNVKLTWDETDPQRQRATMRKFKKEDVLQMDFDAYLASSTDEDEMMQGVEEDKKDPGSSSEDEEHKIAKYKVKNYFNLMLDNFLHMLNCEPPNGVIYIANV